MTEQDAYVKRMDAEKERLDAHLAEIEAQADIARSDEELQELTGMKMRREVFHLKLDELRHRNTRDFEQARKDLDTLRDSLSNSLERATQRLDQFRATYERKREAELRQLGAQFEEWESGLSASRAEDAQLTHEELRFLRREFEATDGILRRLMTARATGWNEAREDYDNAWNDLVEHSRQIREKGRAEPPPAHAP